MSDDTDAGELPAMPQTGVYLVVTLTGSHYRIDFDQKTATRFPDPDDADPAKNLRQDENERPLLRMGALEIGHDLVMVLNIRGDGIPTVRRTTPVVSWVRIA
ncbi:hypothetical protein [Frondihabitans sp. Leaf304]|uniref:hypothetical protein n=1 Tax=Frondihabitans sp. Leaf304 TaxID=1736329 RepID=UPI0006F49CB6|nr:hypothetical protein [Frondihabitans sp. Leaf304]KQQ28653.1 hypothetical protein ASF54_08390 [Frondihabitans sp. Leaf304]